VPSQRSEPHSTPAAAHLRTLRKVLGRIDESQAGKVAWAIDPQGSEVERRLRQPRAGP